MTSGQIKFLTLLFALVNVWLLFHIPAVGEATLKFVSVGQIPGTDTSLSPNVMLYLAIGAFVVSVLLIFWREFRKLFKRRQHVSMPVTPLSTARPAAQPLPAARLVAKTQSAARSEVKAAPAVTVVRPGLFVAPRVVTATAASAKRRVALYMSSTRAHLAIWWIAAVRIAKRMSKQVVAKAKIAVAKMKTFAKAAWRTLVPYAKRAWAFAIRVAKASRLLAIDIWRWLEPRIRNFDRWLEQKLHSNQTTAKAIKAGGTLTTRATVHAQKLGRLARTSRDAVRKAWRTATTK
jgi:hypothetical protein